ncbi:MAG TPA: response regulator, partial [Sunxiuqinia sp.]|nr:response regulator [Sunxiuqinia sp.]
ITIFDSSNYPKMSTRDLNPITLTSDNHLWFTNDSHLGIFQFDFNTNHLTYFPSQYQHSAPSTNLATARIFRDPKGQVWVQPTGGGFSLYDPATNQLVPFTTKKFPPQLKFSNIFHAAFFDRQGNLWYNTQSNGLTKVVFSNNNFQTYHLNDGDQSALTKGVRAILQDQAGNVWISSRRDQVILLDKNLKRLGTLSPSGQLEQNAFWSKPAYEITQDRDLNIWIGTRGDGLYKFSPTKKNYLYQVEHFTENDSIFSLSNNDIYSVFQDRKGRIWIGTLGGGINLVQTTDDGKTRFINFRNKWENTPFTGYDRARCITESENGLIYSGTTNGLLVFNPEEILNGKFNIHHYGKTKGKNTGFNDNDVIDICITKHNDIIIATGNGGIARVASTDSLGFPTSFKNYTQGDGLPSNNIISVQDDLDGKVWVTSYNQLARFNPQKDFFEVFPDVKWALLGNNFSEATSIRLKSGELLFGYSDGLLHFFPDQIKTNTFSPYLALSDFQLFNKNVPIGGKSPLQQTIDNCKKLILSHKQDFFNLKFAALDYENPDNINYAYKLEGFDEDWNYVQKQRTAVYTNVPKGEYTFKVKSTNSQGVWVNNERQLSITVKPSFWETRWAYALYLLVFAALLVLINYTVFTIYKLKSDVRVEKKMSAMKQKFFIDISHEIRTPLTMISAPIEFLINDNRTPETVKKQLTYVAQSSTRMLRLVNQILDFRKMQDLKMKVSETNLPQFVNEIFNDFVEMAREQEIDFNFKNEAGEAKIWADKNSLEKIIMNLLSNAFKFTPKEKSITVKLTRNDKQVSLHVIDEGVGIAKEKQTKLFTRFVSFNRDASNPSTGIGLSLVKELADKHHAKVTVDSEPEKGSTFSVHFEQGKSHFQDEVEFIPENAVNEQSFGKVDITAQRRSDGEEKKAPQVLLVEDDPELRSFIKSILEDDYLVLEAEDGEQGYHEALDKNPDFIVSDIMMPKMDGIELLKKLRENVQSSHIPIILLTAKTNIESKLEGLTYGADDYITKPFSVPYFKTRIENLLSQRKRLQEIFGAAGQVGSKEFNPKPFLVTPQDEEIMEKVLQITEENMDNSDFSVEELATAVGLNRTTMFYKIKSLTGYSPVEFIRDIRLKRAAQLITDSQLLIKEISYMTGFSDLKYFGKCFKTKYGMTPMEYRKRKK